MLDLRTAHLSVFDMSTPQLVREFAEIKMASARGDRFTATMHVRLGDVVSELRRRGVLD